MAAETIFIEVSLIVLIATVIALLARIFKQPLIIAYILTGILISPYFLNLVKSTDSISAFAQMGVAILLFMVGLNLNPKEVKDVGKVAIITGLGQIIFTFILAYLITKLLGFTTIISIYLGIAISFSSTIVIMKLLTDKGELNTLYGRISVGFLIVQDLVAIIILMVISSLSQGSDLGSIALSAFLKGLGLLIVLTLIGIFALPKITKSIAKSQELLLLFSIAWAFILGTIFNHFGFSIEIGALLAGITLSFSPYRFEIGSKMKPLRDFFILLFFILLGSQMTFTNISDYLGPTLALSALILLGNPLIVIILMSLLGYTKRNSFLSGLAVSQISEFSFILIALGVSVGHLPQEMIALTTLIGLITIGGSTYAILYANKLYSFLSPALSIFERKGEKKDESRYHYEDEHDVILFGYNRIGSELLETFNKIKKKALVVDFNPDTIKSLVKEGTECRYGDASDSELLSELNIKKSKMIISTIPEFETNALLIKKVKAANKKAIIIVISHQLDDAEELYRLGATYVIMPHFLGGHHTATLIESYGLDLNKFNKEKESELKNIEKRKKHGHKHPLHERD